MPDQPEAPAADAAAAAGGDDTSTPPAATKCAAAGDSSSADKENDPSERNRKEGEGEEHDPYYPPIIVLPEVEVNCGEDDEDVLVKLRAKLFRFDTTTTTEEEPPEWKERGTGNVKLLKHHETGKVRLLMRRDKTLKICANHLIQPWFQLQAHCGSDRAFVWSVQADFADEEPKAEMLAIRFANADNANAFKAKFDEAVKEAVSAEAKKIAKGSEGEKEEEEEKLSKMVEKVEISGEK